MVLVIVVMVEVIGSRDWLWWWLSVVVVMAEVVADNGDS